MEWIDKRRFLLIIEFSPFFAIVEKVDLYVEFFSVEIDHVNNKSVKIVIRFNKRNQLLIHMSAVEMIENSVDWEFSITSSLLNFKNISLLYHLSFKIALLYHLSFDIDRSVSKSAKVVKCKTRAKQHSLVSVLK